VVRFTKQPAALLAQDISFNKESGSGQSYWHQDYSYFPCDRKGGLTVWVALVDLSEDMGPIRYMEARISRTARLHPPPADLRDTYPQLWTSSGCGMAMAAGDAVVHWD